MRVGDFLFTPEAFKNLTGNKPTQLSIHLPTFTTIKLEHINSVSRGFNIEVKTFENDDVDTEKVKGRAEARVQLGKKTDISKKTSDGKALPANPSEPDNLNATASKEEKKEKEERKQDKIEQKQPGSKSIVGMGASGDLSTQSESKQKNHTIKITISRVFVHQLKSNVDYDLSDDGIDFLTNLVHTNLENISEFKSVQLVTATQTQVQAKIYIKYTLESSDKNVDVKQFNADIDLLDGLFNGSISKGEYDKTKKNTKISREIQFAANIDYTRLENEPQVKKAYQIFLQTPTYENCYTLGTALLPLLDQALESDAKILESQPLTSFSKLIQNPLLRHFLSIRSPVLDEAFIHFKKLINVNNEQINAIDEAINLHLKGNFSAQAHGVKLSLLALSASMAQFNHYLYHQLSNSLKRFSEKRIGPEQVLLEMMMQRSVYEKEDSKSLIQSLHRQIEILTHGSDKSGKPNLIELKNLLPAIELDMIKLNDVEDKNKDELLHLKKS